MDKIILRLRDYGADVDGAIERFVDDKEFYISSVKEYLDDTGFDTLKNALEANDIKTAFEAAHTLKGVVGNLGLIPLYNAVCEIVEPLRAGTCTGLDPKLSSIMDEREKIRGIF